jgi:hypothetical protein
VGLVMGLVMGLGNGAGKWGWDVTKRRRDVRRSGAATEGVAEPVVGRLQDSDVPGDREVRQVVQ